MSDRSQLLDMDTLSKKSGVSPRRIRSWIEGGLVPGPMGKGRRARYDQEHLETVQLIESMREANLPLNVIRAYIDEHGVSPTAAETSDVNAESAEDGSSGPEEWASIHVGQGAKHKNPLAGLATAGEAGKALIAKAGAAVTRPRSASIGSVLAGLAHSSKKPAAEPPASSLWERIPLSPDIEIHVKVSRLSSKAQSADSDIEASEQKALVAAIEMLEDTPDGLAFDELVERLQATDSTLSPDVVPYLLWRLIDEDQRAVYNVADGVLRLGAASQGLSGGSSEAQRSMATSDHPSEFARGTVSYVRVLSRLVTAAEERATLTYPELAEALGLTPRGAHLGAQVGRILDLVSEDEVRAGRPMLSAVVVGYRRGPGPGFYRLARDLGRLEASDTRGERDFWKTELEAVYETWARPQARP